MQLINVMFGGMPEVGGVHGIQVQLMSFGLEASPKHDGPAFIRDVFRGRASQARRAFSRVLRPA